MDWVERLGENLHLRFCLGCGLGGEGLEVLARGQEGDQGASFDADTAINPGCSDAYTVALVDRHHAHMPVVFHLVDAGSNQTTALCYSKLVNKELIESVGFGVIRHGVLGFDLVGAAGR